MMSIDWYASKFLPYGLLPVGDDPDDDILPDWRGSHASFLHWRKELLEKINHILWPKVDRDHKKWVGPAIQLMEPLTSADLHLIHKIRQPGSYRLFDQIPRSPLRRLDCPAHSEFFKREDGQEPDNSTANNIQLYDRQIDPDKMGAGLVSLMNRSITNKVTLGLIYWFKYQLERPRAYQTSMLLGIPITDEGAQTALHPSMISGHCVQGLGALLTIAERMELDAIPFTDDDWEALSQFLVDMGDRRVMAAVHYPSDNMASWLVALELCDHVIDPQVQAAVKKRAWQAISERSLIYQEIKAVVNEDSPYWAAWQELNRHAPSK